MTNQSLHERRIFPSESVTGGDLTFWTGTFPCNLPSLAHLKMYALTYTHSHCFLINIRTDWWEVPLDCLSQNQSKMKSSSGQTSFLGASCRYPHSFLGNSGSLLPSSICQFVYFTFQSSQLPSSVYSSGIPDGVPSKNLLDLNLQNETRHTDIG